MANKDQQLKVELTGGLLTISIGVSEMCSELRNLSALKPSGDDGVAVVDEDAFARAVAGYLQRADDRGITLIHYLLNDAAEDVIAGAAEGVRSLGDV